MALGTPVIVQVGYMVPTPNGPNNITLPNPVGIGNQIFMLTAGGVGFSSTPQGWSLVGTAGISGADINIYQQTAASAFAPNVSVTSTSALPVWGVMMEVANAGAVNCSILTNTNGASQVKLNQFGATESIAGLYMALRNLCVV